MAIDQESARATEDPAWHKGLDIREKRSWKTWQLFVAIMLALVAGMAIGNLGSKSASATGADKPLYSLPPDAGSSTSAQPTTSARPTTSASVQPTPSGSLKTGPVTILLPNKNGTGPNTTVTFTAGGQWKLGWAYDCQLARNGSGNFAVFVVPSSGTAPSSPALQKSGRSGSGVLTLSSTGAQRLRIQTDNACRWAVKVTGVA
jgi:hypothetical protein